MSLNYVIMSILSQLKMLFEIGEGFCVYSKSNLKRYLREDKKYPYEGI